MPPKRKRSSTLSSVKNAAADEPRPPSRDPPGQDADGRSPQDEGSLKHRKQADAADPPSKRTRASKAENGSLERSPSCGGERHPSQAGARPGRKDVKGPSRRALTDGDKVLERLEHGESGEKGTMRMRDPPRAGLVDPKGYHTNSPPSGRPVRVYADGVFDLFHLGHMRQLQQAKQAFPEVYLIVGVTGDKETHRRKGLTVLSAKERAESVRHCKWVDEVIEDCPWIIADAPEFIERHRIDYVAHDDIPYGADEGDDIYAPIKAQGKFLVTQRTEGVSTTGIITKIVRDYDKYIARQLRRGTSRQELNVSWLKKNQLEIKRTMTELRDNIKSNWTTTGQEIGRDLRQFWQSSRPASPARTPTREKTEGEAFHLKLTSPSALARLSHLDIPSAPAANGEASDFAAGYSLGLIGSVRAWMARSKRNLLESRPDSPEGSDDSAEDRSPVAQSSRERRRDQDQDDIDAQVAHEMDVRS